MNRFAVKALAAAMLCALLAPLAWAGQADPLVIEDLRCSGNAATSCEFILGHVYLGPGDALDETELQNAQLRLSTLRTFQSVNVYLEKGSERGKAVVVIEVVEADPIATEWMLGASYRLGAFRSVAAGRLLHQNLFGAGKLADLSIVAVTPLNGPSEERFAASARYADPHLFGSKRYFAIAGMSYVDAEVGDSRYDNFSDDNVLRIGTSIGRRIWDFSYLMVGYSYRALNHQRRGHWREDGSFEIEVERNRHVIDFMYGWNSEDDLYFPTRGSSFHIGFGWDFGAKDDSDDFYVQFRKTWQVGTGYASFLLSGSPSHEYRQTFNEGQLLGASYAHPIEPSGNIKRGRWYVEGGYSSAGYDSAGHSLREHGLKLGLRLDTESLGLIDLYLFGSWDPSR